MAEPWHCGDLTHSIYWLSLTYNVTCCCLLAKLCTTLCSPMDCSTPGSSVLHYLLEFAQTHVHRVGDAIQPSHPLLSPSPLTFNLFQHQGLFQKVSYSHQVAKVLEPSASASVFPVNIQHWFPLGLTSLISLQSKGLSGVFSNTTVQKHQKYWVWFTVLSSRSL